MTERICRICGYFDEDGDAPWTNVENQLYPSYEICPCCGAEHGFDDVEEAGVISYRVNWLKGGAPFSIKRLMPSDWSLEMATKQLNNVPLKWR